MEILQKIVMLAVVCDLYTFLNVIFSDSWHSVLFYISFRYPAQWLGSPKPYTVTP